MASAAQIALATFQPITIKNKDLKDIRSFRSGRLFWWCRGDMEKCGGIGRRNTRE
jgi:hypothetical protein